MTRVDLRTAYEEIISNFLRGALSADAPEYPRILTPDRTSYPWGRIESKLA